MINALLLLALLCQDADVAVTGRGRRTGGEYELTVTGRGKGLKDQETLSLRFRRLVNRMNWEDGSILTAGLDEEIGRTAVVEMNEFVHHERFATPGEVEVRIEDRNLRRSCRVSTLPEEANAIVSASKRFDGALRGLRLLLDDVESMKGEMSPARKQVQIQKRIDWRKKAYREEVADSFLSASAHAFAQLMADVESAMDLERSGKDATPMMSALTGKPFSWEEARAQLGAVEALSLRERALLIVRAAGAAAQEIGERVRSGEPGTFARFEKEVIRTIDALKEIDQVTRSGPSAEHYAALVDVDGATIGELLDQVRDYLQAGAGCIHCAKSNDGCFAGLGQTLMDRLARFEQRIRTQK